MNTFYGKDSIGNQFWTLEDGRLHREDGPAYITHLGTKSWALHGMIYKTEHFNGTIEHFKVLPPQARYTRISSGCRHCENGPAIIYPDGTKEYWLDGEKLELKDWIKRAKYHGTFLSTLLCINKSTQKTHTEGQNEDYDEKIAPPVVVVWNYT